MEAPCRGLAPGAPWARGSVLLRALLVLVLAEGLPQVRLGPRQDGSMRLIAGDAAPGCGAELAPRGVSLAVKGPPWIPILDHFDRAVSMSSYDLEQLASAGVNMIRLGAMMPGVLPNPPENGVYTPDHEYISKLKSFVDNAAAHGMYTLIEFHQDIISPHYCGEGLPRWAADEIQSTFSEEFVDEVLELLHRLTIDVPGIDMVEDSLLRGLLWRSVDKAQFPMPVAQPYKVLNGQQRVYAKGDCDKFEWYQYQLSFAAGHAYRRLFDLSSDTFQHVLNYWKILAEAFKGNPNVLAFDLFNEPHPGNVLTEPWIMTPENAERRLSPFYKAIAEAIHQIDADRLITFSPVTWEEGGYYIQAMNGPAKQMCAWLREALLHIPLPACETFWDITRWMPAEGIEKSAFTEAPLPGQSILSFHFYTPPELNHEAYARKRRSDAQKLQVYPLLSETCCLMDADALQRLYWFEHQQIGWVMWEYKHMANGRWVDDQWIDDYGAMITGTGPDMFSWDGTPIKEHWRRLAHPSAQYVRGEVLANIFDFTVGTFNLTFVPTLSQCGHQGPDATIVWPWTWWAYINITSIPKIQVTPRGAAEVSELLESDLGFASPVLRFGVHVRSRTAPITVTLSFMNFKNIDLQPEQPEPSVFGPWYQGLGWPCFLFLVAVLHFALLACCCRRCCLPGLLGGPRGQDLGLTAAGMPEAEKSDSHRPLFGEASRPPSMDSFSLGELERREGAKRRLGSLDDQAPLMTGRTASDASGSVANSMDVENPEITGREERRPLTGRKAEPDSASRRSRDPCGALKDCLSQGDDRLDSERTWTADLLENLAPDSKEGDGGL